MTIQSNKIEFKTKRLLIRKIKLSDKKQVFSLGSNNETLKYVDSSTHNSIDDSILEIKRIENEFNNSSSFFFGICLNPNTEIIGIIGIYNIDYKHKFASSKSILLKEYWGKGIVSEAQKKIIEFAFNTLDLNRIECQVHTEHSQSIKRLKKLGFKKEGRLRQNFLIDNKFYDSYIFSLLKNDSSSHLM